MVEKPRQAKTALDSAPTRTCVRTCARHVTTLFPRRELGVCLQEGSVAAANSAAAAVEAGGKKGFGGNLRVLIHERDGPHDKPLSMSRDAYQLVSPQP